MKTAYKHLSLIALLAFCLAGCTKEEDAVKPLATANQDELIGWSTAVCNLVQTFGATSLPSLTTTIEEDGVLMRVTTQRRGHNGKYLSETPGLLVKGRETPEMIDFMDAVILAVGGMLTIPDESGQGIHQNGGRILIDFSPVGSVTFQDIIITDIDENEKGSKIELYSSSGQLLLSKELPVTGDKSPQFVFLENTPGVAKAIVTFGGERSLIGSGAIARMQMCKEGVGRCISSCQDVNKVWLQYVGSRPINVKASKGTEILMNSHGMKPGTMFKLESDGNLNGSLVLQTNRKDVHLVSLTCENGRLALSGDGDLFRIVEARNGGSFPLCLQ